ncbi:MAG: nucleotidyltransferase domain-containing protein [Methanobrevibacter sp.]|jgi:predicted nucleotidyltransferase|nr:nucleotidyltransferase domain-containing protein [Candidatus Methanoflexus mossambicus]
MNKKEIAIKYANSLKNLEVDKIILYGSVARGDDYEDSDIDILILSDNKDEIKDEIHSKATDLMLETMEYISVLIKPLSEFKRYIDLPFYLNVYEEGIIIG